MFMHFILFIFILSYILQEDYELLVQMNNLTTTKYADMRQIANKVAKQVSELNTKCKFIQWKLLLQI